MMSKLLEQSLDREERDSKIYGVVSAIVTNNKDEDGMARVKVKFPWLAEEDESYWARIVTFMAGNERGSYFIPEVDDEVLVAFENGDINYPYILGSLWNGKDKPHEKNEDGKNDLRVFKSRSGHKVIFDDKKDSEKITIIDKTEKRKIVFDVKEKLIEIKNEEADGKIKIYSKSDIEIKGDAKIDIIAKDNITIKSDKTISLDAKDIKTKSSASTKIEAGSTFGLKSTSSSKIEAGAKLDIKSTAPMKIESSATMGIKATAPLKMESSAKFDLKTTGMGKVEATGKLDLKSAGMASLESSGITMVKGSLLKLN